MNKNDKKSSNLMNNLLIGIVGFGHLGSSIALSLINGGLSRKRILISHGTTAATQRRAASLGFASCMTSTQDLMKKSDIIILAAKPQDIGSFASYDTKKDAVIISFMAAIPTHFLQKLFKNNEICRAMCSGPETLISGSGVGAFWPKNPAASELFLAAGIKKLDISFEEELDALTVGICIPPIVMNFEISREETLSVLLEAEKDYPMYGRLLTWILHTAYLENNEKSEKKENILKNISTKGGVTENMAKILFEGGTFKDAIKRGMARISEMQSKICAAYFENVA